MSLDDMVKRNQTGNAIDDFVKGKTDHKAQRKEIAEQISHQSKLIKRVFDGIDGQELLKILEKTCFVNQTTLDDRPAKMGYNEGRRSVYVFIKYEMNRDLTGIVDEIMKGQE